MYTKDETQLMMAAADPNKGGIALFTSYWLSPQNAQATARWDLVGRPIDQWDLKDGQFVPVVPLDFAIKIAHGAQTDYTIIAGFGAGKTVNIGLIHLYYACMMRGYRGMNMAPVAWQANMMYKELLSITRWTTRDQDPTRICRLIDRVVEKPFPVFYFKNGSSIEFMSGDEQGAKIRSWSGDVGSIDEAQQIDDLIGGIITNLGSRLRGQTGGRARLGKLIVMGNGDWNPDLWQLFDMAQQSPRRYASFLLTSYDNPYISKDQIATISERLGDEERVKTLIYSERPMPPGKEFRDEIMAPCRSKELDNLMAAGLRAGANGYLMRSVSSAGVVRWQLPPSVNQMNILVGDPGQSNPPERNSPPIFVFDIAEFPQKPAKMVAFNWIFGNNSYWPFIEGMEELYDVYNPVRAVFDNTGVQKAFDELVFVQRGPQRRFEGFNLAMRKQACILALKMMMGRGLIQIPAEAKSIWLQLAGWQMPDTKLRQDIVSALSILGFVLHQTWSVANTPSKPADEISTDVHVKASMRMRGGRARLPSMRVANVQQG